MPGRADQGEDGPGALVLLDAALLAQLPHGQVLDDPVLDVLEPGMVGVQHLAGVGRVEPLLRALRPRDEQEPVQVAADDRRLGPALAHALEPAELALRLLADVVGHAGLGDLLPVLVDDRAVVLSELLADRLHLLAQDVVALLLLGAGLDVLADALAHLHLGQALALQLEGELESLAHVQRLEQLNLLLEGQIG